ncbi:MAG: peptidoglycan-binding protein [Cypionkella sp.]|uniref:serine protease n=1 Tax=Cypionkella sp. TaxID=2811411 RepID=UPI00260B186B|nr:serine protease [Cypionkella sp.]MDB5661231.1 peptidoglycan-binding protein [Cypionkella sp.]
MRLRMVVLALLAVLGFGSMATAQEQAWLQVEAQPSLAEAEARARAYAAEFPNVSGYQLSSGWYAIVLGPYSPEAAAGALSDLRGDGAIPGDSFVTDDATHRQQFWPVGAIAGQVEVEPLLSDPLIVDPMLADPAIEAVDPVIEVMPAEETVREAKASEAELDADGRKALQTAMAWYGFYEGGIDGAFGPGTRNSMAAWQEANGFEATGVLTSKQRAALVGNYQADQAEFGFASISEPEAGIEITLPMALVEFDHYEPPFVHYNEKANSGLKVILISEPGNQDSLSGLYDVLQTLEVVPAEGERSKSEKSFTINAASSAVQSYAYAELKDGMVKGYLVVWNPADAERMSRILPALKASFRGVGDKALDPGLVPMDAATRSGLLAGMEVKLPKLSRSGFFVDASGVVVTTVEAVAQCGRVTIDHATDATVVAQDQATGIAILRPVSPLAPPAFARFAGGAVRLGSEVAVAGYSYEDKLPAPVLTFGTLEEEKGLNGEAGISRLAAPVLPGDAGGPVLDATGAVLGMLLPPAVKGAKLLPDGVAFAAQAGMIGQVLTASGVVVTAATSTDLATPDALNAAGLGMTVLVSCWE